MTTLEIMGEKAKKSARALALLQSHKKNEALLKMAGDLVEKSAEIVAANKIDMENAKGNGISDVMLDRLMLNESRIKAMADGIEKIAALSDPIGEIREMKRLQSGLTVGKKRVPMGVIGMIYESRPNVTADAAALCFKASNAVILRGGKEAINSNLAIASIMSNSLKELSIDENAIQIISDTSRESASELMRMRKYVDLLIPRGGAGLISAVVENSTVPVIETGTGNCHIFVDKSADLAMAANIVNNAKTSRPSVCNAAESLLVHEDIAGDFLPLVNYVLKKKNVKILGCERTCAILKDASLATEEDYYAEFLDYIISVKVVADVNEAIDHIEKYSTHHSDAIVTKDYDNAQLFLNEVDSAAVYVNASTRFTDGFEFGLGAEVGISTQKLHARGPMGLDALTSEKFIIYGDGQIRL